MMVEKMAMKPILIVVAHALVVTMVNHVMVTVIVPPV